MTAGRMLLIAAGLAVAALLLCLFWSSRPAAPPRVVSPPDTAAAPAPRPRVVPAVADEPPAAVAADAGPKPRGDHDHRGEGRVAPLPRTHSADTIAAVMAALAPGAAACGSGVTAGRDGPVQVLVNATIRTVAGRISAADVTVDGAEGLGAAYATCLARAVDELNLQAPAGQADGDDPVHMPFRAP